MNTELKILYIEDDEENLNGLVNILNDEKIENKFTIHINGCRSFEEALSKIQQNSYHIVILDIYEGNPRDEGETKGLKVLKQIQDYCFLPIIFYSGNTRYVKDYRSQIVGVASKGDGGIEELKKEIHRLVKYNIPFIKENIHNYIEKELKTFFWNIIHNQRDKFSPEKNDFSLGYLMLRNFGKSLSQEKISEILGDNSLTKDKVNPMSFYLYPIDKKLEYENGEILEKGNDVYVILTPSCDFVDRGDNKRRVEKVLLAKTELLKKYTEFINFISPYKEDGTLKKAGEKHGEEEKLRRLIESRKGDRYFFLPQTPFIENRVIDFQNKEMTGYECLKDFTRLAKLDSPFAESMTASFIRYYNRIGAPDIDSDYIINNCIPKTLEEDTK